MSEKPYGSCGCGNRGLLRIWAVMSSSISFSFVTEFACWFVRTNFLSPYHGAWKRLQDWNLAQRLSCLCRKILKKKSVVCFFSFLQKLRRKAYQGMQLLSVLITKELLHSNECGCLNCAVVN
jgi:hypothetical protein